MDAGHRVRMRGMIALLGVGVLVGACHSPPPPHAATAASEVHADYVPPPELASAAREPAGDVALSGTARPGATIRLASPDGAALQAAVSASGVWTLTIPTGLAPRLYSLTEVLPDRPVRAKGYVATLPLPASAAVVLRPGGGAEPLTGREPRLRLSGVDFDGSGAGVAAGLAQPGDTVRLELDGVETGVGRANARGVFTVPLAQTLRPGPHALTASTSRAQARAAFDAAPAAPMAHPPF